MSEWCPCGSDLKTVDCCTGKSIARMKQRSLSGQDFTGRRRWAESYITYKTIINGQIIEAQEHYVKSQGREMTCRDGCSMCCGEFIAARLEECDAIAMYLYSHPAVMNTFLVNYKGWYRNITAGENVLNKTAEAYQALYETRLPEDKKTFEACALAYAGAYTPCPFLEEDSCLIYKVRPFVCSTYGVVSHKKYCDPKWHRDAVEHKVKIKSAINPLDFENSYFIDLDGRMIFGPMPKMVHDILKYGPKAII